MTLVVAVGIASDVYSITTLNFNLLLLKLILYKVCLLWLAIDFKNLLLFADPLILHYKNLNKSFKVAYSYYR